MGQVVVAPVNGGRGSAARLIDPRPFVSTDWLVTPMLCWAALIVR